MMFIITLQRFSLAVSLSFHDFDTFRQFNRFGPSKYLRTLSRSSGGKSVKKSLNSNAGNFSCNLQRCSGPHESKSSSTKVSKSFLERPWRSFNNLETKGNTLRDDTISYSNWNMSNLPITWTMILMTYLERSVLDLSSIWCSFGVC